MSGFALPPDPAEKKKKKEEEEEAKKPKVPPEQESVHRMVFAVFLYFCLLLLLVLLVPAVGSSFNTKSRIPEPGDASGPIASVWSAVDQLVVVRRRPREANLLRAFVFRSIGPLWWLMLVPPLVIVALQVAIKDKELACRAHYLVSLGMTLGLIGIAALTIAELVAMQQGG